MNYSDLYKLCSELQQLVGAQLQAVYNPSSIRYVMEFRLPQESRILIIDLTPARPYIVSTTFTKTKSLGKKSPVVNFLKAHFVPSRLEKLELAQKPNRTVRMVFSNNSEAIFKCFPHGQHFTLAADEKFVQLPLRPKTEDAPIAYVEPLLSKSWECNDSWAQQYMTVPQALPGEPAHLKIVKRVERAIHALDQGVAQSENADQSRIQELEAQVARVSGKEIQGLFHEIKRIKKKIQTTLNRRTELVQQLENLKAHPESPPAQQESPRPRGRFSGTRVRLSEHWELWIGRNDHENDDLLRTGSSHDLWLHLRDRPGAHGLIRGPKNSQVTQTQIETAARIVAVLSQNKKKPFSDGEKLDFIVTPKKFVRKRKGAAPGRVIVERETVRRIAFKSLKFDVIR